MTHPAPLSQLLSDLSAIFANAPKGVTLSPDMTALIAASLGEAVSEARALEQTAARSASNIIDLSAIFAREQESRRHLPEHGGAA